MRHSILLAMSMVSCLACSGAAKKPPTSGDASKPAAADAKNADSAPLLAGPIDSASGSGSHRLLAVVYEDIPGKSAARKAGPVVDLDRGDFMMAYGRGYPHVIPCIEEYLRRLKDSSAWRSNYHLFDGVRFEFNVTDTYGIKPGQGHLLIRFSGLGVPDEAQTQIGCGGWQPTGEAQLTSSTLETSVQAAIAARKDQLAEQQSRGLRKVIQEYRQGVNDRAKKKF